MKSFKRIIIKAAALTLAFLIIAAVIPADLQIGGRSIVQSVQALTEKNAGNIRINSAENEAASEYGYIPDHHILTSDGSGSTDRNAVLKATLPTSYSSVSNNRITSVKNQGDYGCCWAFSTISSIESSLITEGSYTKSNVDFSELHLAYFAYHRPNDPLGLTAGDTLGSNDADPIDNGGNYYISTLTLASGIGPVNDSVLPYSKARLNASFSSSLAYADRKATIKNVYEVSAGNSSRMKELIMQYGSLGISYFHDSAYYDSYHGSYYNFSQEGTNHAVSIVGWDDSYSRSNFISAPAGNGAWLVKNSWGSSWGNSGYFWLSYYDKAFKPYQNDGTYNSCFAFEFTSTVNKNDSIYQYDGGTVDGTIDIYTTNSVSSYSTKAANVYTAQNDELIKSAAIMTATENLRYSLQFYRNPANGKPDSGTALLSSPLTGTFRDAGYHTVTLPTPVKVASGTKFSAVFTLTVSGKEINIPVDFSYSNYALEFSTRESEGQSFYYDIDDKRWYDLYDTSCTARIKVTTESDLDDSEHILYSTSFESSGEVSEWSFIDRDGDGYTWLGTINDSRYSSFTANTGSYCLSSASFINNVGILYPDNYAVSPKISIPSSLKNVVLTWYACGQDSAEFRENYSVYIYTGSETLTRNNVSSLLTSPAFTGVTSAPTYKDQLSVDLTAYSGKTVQVVFRHHNVSDEYWLNIDDVCVSYFDFIRLAGNGRQQTAVEISKAAFPSGASNAVIASGDNYADALAGVSLAYALDAPILLVRASGLDDDTLNELYRLRVSNVYILGGTGAVSQAAQTKLEGRGYNVERIYGDNRFETAVAISRKLCAVTGRTPDEAFIVYGYNYPDALAIGNIAAIKGSPLLYIEGSGVLDSGTSSFISGCGASKATILGGTGIISSRAESSIISCGINDVSRIYGDNRYLTCMSINKAYADVLTGNCVCLATGTNFPDALAGGVFAAKQKSPMLLVCDTLLPEHKTLQNNYIKALGADDVYVFGGTGAVSNKLANDVYKLSL